MIPAILIIGIAGLIMGIRMIIQKNGKFPETEVGHNKEMKKRGIVCAKAEERIYRSKLEGKPVSNSSCGSCQC